MAPSWEVVQGDSVEVLRALPDASIDAVVCDPPAGIAFMGKAWDRPDGVGASEASTAREAFVRPMASIFREVYRVLKPGGHALVWALPRTQHWTATAVEDAGFDIRDVLAHNFLSGFPKSLDVSKAIDSSDRKEPAEQRARTFTAWMRSTGITAQQINDATDSYMGSHYLTDKTQPLVATADLFDRLRPLLPPVPEEIEELVRSRTVESENMKRREVVETKILPINPGFSSVVYQKAVGLKNVNITAPATDAARTWSGWGTALKPSHEAWILARRPLEGTVAANVLKHRTGALNVDGCRVVTEGEVLHTPRGNPSAREGEVGKDFGFSSNDTEDFRRAQRESIERTNTLGRWPPNMLLSHGPGCVPTGAARVKSRSGLRPDDLGKDYGVHKSGSMAGAKRAIVTVTHAAADGTEAMETWACEPGCPVAELDRQSGITTSNGGKFSGSNAMGQDSGWNAHNNRLVEIDRPTDTGGASRMFPRFDYAHEQAEEEAGVAPSFHYFPKPSRSEREAGCDDLPARSGAASVGREEGSPGAQSPRAGAGRNAKEIRNIHPTVKSIALMRWLCRLVAPPGGTVLDPFTGSGTTGCAAVLEGFDFVGIEREEEYAAIARARIGHWASVAAKGEPPPKVRRPREPKPEVAPPPVEVAPPPPIVPPAPVVTPSPPPKKKRKTETSTFQIPFLFSTQETP